MVILMMMIRSTLVSFLYRQKPGHEDSAEVEVAAAEDRFPLKQPSESRLSFTARSVECEKEGEEDEDYC